jgi:hypothetical protein
MRAAKMVLLGAVKLTWDTVMSTIWLCAVVMRKRVRKQLAMFPPIAQTRAFLESQASPAARVNVNKRNRIGPEYGTAPMNASVAFLGNMAPADNYNVNNKDYVS